MPRWNSGPHLGLSKSRQLYYINWTENGYVPEGSTGTADRQQAEIALAHFLRDASSDARTRDPSEVLVTDVLADCAEEHAPTRVASTRIGVATGPLVEIWAGLTLTKVTRQTYPTYEGVPGRAPGAVRRELGVLRSRNKLFAPSDNSRNRAGSAAPSSSSIL